MRITLTVCRRRVAALMVQFPRLAGILKGVAARMQTISPKRREGDAMTEVACV